MANSRKTRSYRGASRRTSGSGALIDTVRNTLTGGTGNRARGRSGGRRGGNLVTQASGFVSGLLSGNGGGKKRSRRSAGGRRAARRRSAR